MKYPKIVLLLVVLFTAWAFGLPCAIADHHQDMMAKVTSDNYAERAFFRLTHGLLNAGLGWTQFFVEPYKSVTQEGQDIVDGIFEGIAYSGYYTILGGWDLATFWVPGQGGKDIAVKECVAATFK